MSDSEETKFYRSLYDYFFRLLQIIDEEKALTSSQAFANQTLQLIEKVEAKAIPKTSVKVFLYLQSIMDDLTLSCSVSIRRISKDVRNDSKTIRRNLAILEKFQFIEIEQNRDENGNNLSNKYFLKTPLLGVPPSHHGNGSTPYHRYDGSTLKDNINYINKEDHKNSENLGVAKDDTKNEIFQELIAFGCFPSFARKAIDKSAEQTKNIFESFKETNKTTYLLEKYKPALFGALKMLTENATVETIASKYDFTRQKSKSKPLYFIQIKGESGAVMPFEFQSRKDAYEYIKQEFQHYSNEDDIREASERWLNQHLKLIV